MGVWMDYVRRKAERWQQTWGEAALAASEKQEPLTLEGVHIDKARLAESAVEYWKQRYATEKKEHAATKAKSAQDMQSIADFSRLQATCIKSDGICWQCDQLRRLIDALVWDKGEYLNPAGQWVPTGTLTCHFCGVVKGHPHSETCRAKGIGHE